jgi:hypothetical protein
LRKRGDTPKPRFPGGTGRSVTDGRWKQSSREEQEDWPPEGGGAAANWLARSGPFVEGATPSGSIPGEAGVPDRVIMDIAGHVSPRMLIRYSHIQLEAKRAAIQALSNRPELSPVPSYVTKHVTKSGPEEGKPARVIEMNGRPERTRTVDLYRVK